MRVGFHTLIAGVGLFVWVAGAQAEGIVYKVVNSSRSATGTVRGAYTDIDIYLTSPAAPGDDFLDPQVPGYRVPPGGRLEVEMGQGFERVPSPSLTRKESMKVTGPSSKVRAGKKSGFVVGEGDNEKTFVILPAEQGLPSEELKVLHVGFNQSAFHTVSAPECPLRFRNSGTRGTVYVRVIDANGKILHQGSSTVDFLEEAVAQLRSTRLTDEHRDSDWQRMKRRERLGHTPGTMPLTVMLYAKANVPLQAMSDFKQGLTGVGVLSSQQLRAINYVIPQPLLRYTDGLIVQDTNGDGRLDPTVDHIIGGVITHGPRGAQGQELRTLEREGKLVLSAPTDQLAPELGATFGGAILQLQFTAGDKSGKYRPTLVLLRDRADLSGGDGSQHTYTIVVD
jgi:hypothetical protein